MSFSDQLPALAGVAVGASMSFAATYFVERAGWHRNQSVRWDERRLSAYADYSQTVKDIVAIASRLAADRGFEPGLEPLTATQNSLTQLAEAESRRTRASETLRLLADADTMRAAREMTQSAWQLDWLARGKVDGDRTIWRRTYAEYEQARDEYITCARRSLQVSGSHIPGTPSLRSREQPVDPVPSLAVKPDDPETE